MTEDEYAQYLLEEQRELKEVFANICELAFQITPIHPYREDEIFGLGGVYALVRPPDLDFPDSSYWDWRYGDCLYPHLSYKAIVYIGQTQNFLTRFRQHVRKLMRDDGSGNRHHNPYVSLYFGYSDDEEDHYPEQANFCFIVLQVMADSKKGRLKSERRWIKRFEKNPLFILANHVNTKTEEG